MSRSRWAGRSLDGANLRAYCARLIGQKHTHQRTMHFKVSVVVNEPHLAELIHKVAHARTGWADHLRERLLTDLCENWLRSAFLSKIGQQQQQPRQPFLSRVEK